MSDERDPMTAEDLIKLGYEADTLEGEDLSLCTVCSWTSSDHEIGG
jgi:hypothetical protein